MTINRIDRGEEKYLLALHRVLHSLLKFLERPLNTVFRQSPAFANELHAK